MVELHPYYLQQMGIDVWVKRQQKAPDCSQTLDLLAQKVASCTLCALHKNRTQTVFARGNPKARLMIIGEAPGFYEDKKGLPFVGKAGALLDNMLKSVGYGEDQVYIANVIKCRPPDNRDPDAEEIAACSPYLTEQIQQIRPVLILALGRFAGQFIMKKKIPMHHMRQHIHYYEQTPCLVTYHPAYLLRNPVDKKKAYEDLVKVTTMLETL